MREKRLKKMGASKEKEKCNLDSFGVFSGAPCIANGFSDLEYEDFSQVPKSYMYVLFFVSNFLSSHS